MPWDAGLFGPTRDIAASDDPRLRVLAGPGTGKTFALQRLVMRLLEQGHNPRRILVVTFTRTAARDIEQELHHIGVPGCEDIVAGTLHAFCFRLLARADVMAAAGRIARPLVSVRSRGIPGFEYAPLLADLASQAAFGDKRARVKRIRAYEAAWARLQHELPGRIIDPVDQEFERMLVEWLFFHQAILIGELVPLALRHLEQNPLAPELAAYDRVIVDEYQDLNKAEQIIIDRLAANGILMIVGDANQSIYSFRFANPDGVEDFPRRHAATIDKTLTQCRRCPEDIVIAANSLISRNHSLGAAPSMTVFNPPGEIYRVQWANLNDECSGLATYVQHLIGSHRYVAGDIMILCPRRRIGTDIQRRLLAAGITAHSFFHEEILADRDAQESFALLRLLVDKEDRVALRFWLGSRSGNALSPQYGRLRAYCEANGVSPIEALSQMAASTISGTGFSDLLRRYRELEARLAALGALVGQALVDALFPPGDVWAELARDAISPGMANIALPNELLDYLLRYVTQPDVPSHPDYVRIMSIHSSKGLAGKVVIVTTVIDTLVPTYNKDDTTPNQKRDTLAEQRRLFYVAITRARAVLVLSYPARIWPIGNALQLGASVRSGGLTNNCAFLAELNIGGAVASGDVWAARGYTP